MPIEDVWEGRSVAHRAARAALSPLSALLAAGVRARGFLYDRGVLAAGHAPAPVVSIGGLRVGGSGKTPLVLWLAAKLRERGIRPCIVTRGYGGSGGASALLLRAGDIGGGEVAALARRAGDEAVLLALRSRCPVAVGRVRLDACEHAARALAGSVDAPHLFLLDDGFQHRALARDLDIVLVGGDERRRRLLPAGPLREPTSALARAAVVVVMRQAAAAPGRGNEHEQRPEPGPACDEASAFAREAPTALRLGAFSRASILVSAVTDTEGEEPSSLAGRRVVAVAAIARPGRFLADLERTGARIVAKVLRRDHHHYDDADRREIDAAAASADLVVTTEKDLVKLAYPARPGGGDMACHDRMRALRIEVQFDRRQDEAALLERVSALLAFDR